MNEKTAENVIHWYTSLEKQALDFMTAVPPQGHNLKTWSPSLADVMVGACNLIESVLFAITPTQVRVSRKARRRQDVRTRAGIRYVAKRKDLSLEDYAELYSISLRLPERKVFPFHGPRRWWEPFARWRGWKPGTPFHSPTWWQLHNKSKHSRLAYLPDFTLSNTLDAVAGALVVIATVPSVPAAYEVALAMLRHGWLDAERESWCLEDAYKGKSPHYCLCVETSLFAVPLIQDPLPPLIQQGFPIVMA